MATNRQLAKALSSGKLQTMDGVQFISPVQNWRMAKNELIFNVYLFYIFMDDLEIVTVFDIEPGEMLAIRDQLYAEKKGWA